MQTIKCVVVGDGAVGKNCLSTKVEGRTIVSSFASILTTQDVPRMLDIVLIAGKPYGLDVFDTVGEEEYDKRTLVYPGTDIFVVCFSLVSPSSFENVKEKWVPEITHHCPKVPFVLFGTQLGLRNDLQGMLDAN